jgi:hypothetical protein
MTFFEDFPKSSLDHFAWEFLKKKNDKFLSQKKHCLGDSILKLINYVNGTKNYLSLLIYKIGHTRW